MEKDPLATRWQQLAEDVFADLAEWRRQHPKANLTAIERALDERWAKARALIVADTAARSALADLTQVEDAERPLCPQCGVPFQARGQATRRLRTTYEQDIALPRSYAVCPVCGQGVFPPR